MTRIKLLDVSGIFHPIWRVKEGAARPPGEASDETVRALRERAAAGDADYIVACCDAPGRTFRHDIGDEFKKHAPEYRGYKAHRPVKDPAMMAALGRVIDELEQDGVPIMRADGFEADDVIATLTKWAVEQGHEVEIVSDDKDLFQLVRDPGAVRDGPFCGPRVCVVRRDGSVVGREDVRAKFGVEPHQLGEYLAIVGDVSDHVPGVKGLGDKAAQGLIGKHGGYLAALEKARLEDTALASGAVGDQYEPAFTQAQRTKLIEGEKAFRLSLRLTTLRTDVPLDFAAVTAPRVPRPAEDAKGYQIDGYDDDIEDEDTDMPANDSNTIPAAVPQSNASEPAVAEPPSSAQAVSAEVIPAPAAMVVTSPDAAPLSVHIAPPSRGDMAVREIQQVTERSIAPQVGAYSRSLDPRDFREARMLAKDVYDARIFSKIQSPQQALSLIMSGRDYGLPAMAALRLIHIIEGQPAVHAQVKIGLAMKSPRVEYMHIKEWVDDGDRSYCIWVGKRRNRPKEDTCRYGVEDAKRQMLVKPNSNWVKMPGWMSMVRSGANMATILIPDEMAGLYTFDEMGAAEPMPAIDADVARAAYGEHTAKARGEAA